MIFIEEKVKDKVYNINLKSTGIIVGQFINMDGVYYFSENKNRTWGLMSEEFLRSLTIELEKLNKPMNDNIDAYFNFQ